MWIQKGGSAVVGWTPPIDLMIGLVSMTWRMRKKEEGEEAEG